MERKENDRKGRKEKNGSKEKMEVTREKKHKAKKNQNEGMNERNCERKQKQLRMMDKIEKKIEENKKQE